jgi:hypothetical protein
MAEINVGQISEALNNKADLDLNNTNPFADYVVEWKAPTSSDPSWYRLYRSGWIEQGGRTTSNYGSSGTQVQLLKSMNNTDYHLQVTQYTDRRDGMGSTVIPAGYIVDSSTIYVAGRYVSVAEDAKLCWEVKGFAAQS